MTLIFKKTANLSNHRRKLDIDKLIFASNSWHGISDCLWSSATDIKGETTLNKSYPDLEPFFVEFLGVKRMTLDMVYDKLKDQGASDESTASEVKHDLMVFNSLLLLSKQKPDPAPILAGRLFPVKSLDGNVGLCRGESDFAIADRKSLGATFAGKAKLLDFSFDEVLRLQPTLEWLGLENRYLSVAVQEVSGIIADSERPVSSPQRDIKTKAHALCRYVPSTHQMEMITKRHIVLQRTSKVRELSRRRTSKNCMSF